ncbi:MAG: response regulator [Oscillospiraceae bacterium]|nr:response regulator [Oscillospiraceae bacterium]
MEETREIIVMVDDSATNLAMGKKTLSDRYDVVTINSCTDLLSLLEIISPDLILLDIEMPDMSGYDVIKAVKDKVETAHIPVIFLTSRSDMASELEGLTLGAVDYIRKPFSPPLLHKRIELHLLLEAQKRELKSLSEDLFIIIDERTNDLAELNKAVRHLLVAIAGELDPLTSEQVLKAHEFLQGEADKIVQEGDPLRFAPKPAAVFHEREQEYRIVLKEMI